MPDALSCVKQAKKILVSALWTAPGGAETLLSPVDLPRETPTMIGVRLGTVALLCLFFLVRGVPADQGTSQLPLKHTYPAHEKELVSNRGPVAGRIAGELRGRTPKKNDRVVGHDMDHSRRARKQSREPGLSSSLPVPTCIKQGTVPKNLRKQDKGEQTAIKPACVKEQGCTSQPEGLGQALCPLGSG